MARREKFLLVDLNEWSLDISYPEMGAYFRIDFINENLEFYLALIGLVAYNQLNSKDQKSKLIVREHLETISFLDRAIMGPDQSPSEYSLKEKIRKYWPGRLCQIDEARSKKVKDPKTGAEIIDKTAIDKYAAIMVMILKTDTKHGKKQLFLNTDLFNNPKGQILIKYSQATNSKEAWETFLLDLQQRTFGDNKISDAKVDITNNLLGWSPWASRNGYQEDYDFRWPRRMYPQQVEGQVNDEGRCEYRGYFVPTPNQDFYHRTHHGMTNSTFEQNNNRYRNDGFVLTHHQSFINHYGVVEHQATWEPKGRDKKSQREAKQSKEEESVSLSPTNQHFFCYAECSEVIIESSQITFCKKGNKRSSIAWTKEPVYDLISFDDIILECEAKISGRQEIIIVFSPVITGAGSGVSVSTMPEGAVGGREWASSVRINMIDNFVNDNLNSIIDGDWLPVEVKLQKNYIYLCVDGRQIIYAGFNYGVVPLKGYIGLYAYSFPGQNNVGTVSYRNIKITQTR